MSITPPRDRTIVLPTQAFAGTGDYLDIDLEVLVLPSPPATRYRISRDDLLVTSRSLRGDGSGAYRVRVSGGGVEKTTTFVLEPPPSPRLVNLTDDVMKVVPGTRLQFGAAGKKPLSTFRVAIYGPLPTYADRPRTASLLRTTMVARADKRGEAIVTLDVLASSDTGLFYAVLDPKTPPPDPKGVIDPRIAEFEVEAA